MKNYLLIGLLMLSHNAFACDTCSGSMGMIDNGAFQLEKSYVGVVWSYLSQFSKFKSFDTTLKNKTRINQVGLIGAFNFKARYNLSFAIPSFFTYSKNKNTIAIGDPIVNFRYKLFEKKALKNDFASHKLYGSFGLKIPFGVFVNKSFNQVDNINFSTKTLNFLLGVQYVYVKKNKGMNLSFNTRINTKDSDQNRLGHGFVLRSLFFANKSIKKSTLSVFVGLSGEYNTRDVSNGFQRPFTGGKALYLNLGGNININNIISVMLNPELPLVQDYRIQDGTIFTNVRINFNTKILF